MLHLPRAELLRHTAVVTIQIKTKHTVFLEVVFSYSLPFVIQISYSAKSAAEANLQAHKVSDLEIFL